MPSDMFCFQCEQTEGGTGCSTIGVCGKTPEVAHLQDLLIHFTKGISMYANRAAKLDASARDPVVDRFVLDAMFSTLTNVNFDEARFHDYLEQAMDIREKAKALWTTAAEAQGLEASELDGPATDALPTDHDARTEMGKHVGVAARRSVTDQNIFALQELSTYALKGASAYFCHAALLGATDPKISADLMELLDNLTQERTLDECLSDVLKTGELNLRVLDALDRGSSEKYGNPVPTQVSCVPVPGKAILVSGHDLTDMEGILAATAGTGINVYTHGELLPAHAFPGLKEKYPHLVGHYGSAWQNQQFEFRSFPGPIIMTTNCIIEPRRSYRYRIFTRHVTGWPGVTHLETDADYAKVVDSALKEDGFTEDDVADHVGPKSMTTGFHHSTVLALAPAVLEAINEGKLKRFFVIGGCDGSETERSYFTDLANATPAESVVLTLGCGKFRINNQKIAEETVPGTGLPRLLDVGQCNDAYSAIRIAAGLADALKTDVTKLPLSFGVSWFEQKAVAVLTTLLHLGMTDIRLGPNLPAFLTPDVLQVLVDKFGIKLPAEDARDDVEQMMKGH